MLGRSALSLELKLLILALKGHTGSATAAQQQQIILFTVQTSAAWTGWLLSHCEVLSQHLSIPWE